MLNSSLLHGLTESVRFPESTIERFSCVCTDTRKMTEDALFIPLVGDHFNGHDYIDTGIVLGAKASLWQTSEPVPATLPADFQLYFVKDTLAALQQMAKAYREEVNPKVIGITGSNGKTTTKDILSAVLSLHGETYKTQGNYNNHIGLPLTLLAMPSTSEYVILEMGMSEFGEIAFLSQLANPDEVIVTNIGESHMEQLGSRAGIAMAKMEIREGLKKGGTVIVDGDEPLLEPYLDEHCYTVGFSSRCDAVISDVQQNENGYSFSYASSSSIDIPLLGKHNVKNASYSIAIARKLGVPEDVISAGLHDVSLTGMRLERHIGSKGETIINDAYNASPSSMIAAIDTLKTLQGYQKYIAVLGDMFELGEDEEKLHRQMAEVISAPVTHLVLVGEKASWIADEWNKKKNVTIQVVATTSKDEAAVHLRNIVDRQSVVLFKASRGMKLEEIVENYQNNRKGGER